MSAVRIVSALALVALLVMLAPTAQAQGTAAVSGTINYRQRISLPANAIVTMQIAEIASGRSGVVVAEQKFSTNGAQVPFRFTVNFDPARLNQNAAYTIQGNITVDGKVVFTTSSLYRVYTQGNPVSNINVIMSQVGGTRLPNTSGGVWVLTLSVLLLVAFVGVRTVRVRRLARI